MQYQKLFLKYNKNKWMYVKIWCVFFVLYEMYNCVGGPNNTSSIFKYNQQDAILHNGIYYYKFVELFPLS